MARDQGSQQREGTQQQGIGTNVGRSTQGEASQSRQGDQTTDRERSIQTGREGERSRGLAHQPMTAPVFGQSGSPFSLMRRMAEDMDRLFEDFGFARGGLGLGSRFGALDSDLWSGSGLTQATWVPQVETFRRGDKLVVRADLPGLRKEDVKVEIENDVLTISGERREEQEEDRDGYYRSERSYGQFYRAIPLPEGGSDEQCEASFKDGVLEVTLPAPKETEQKRKRIQVR